VFFPKSNHISCSTRDEDKGTFAKALQNNLIKIGSLGKKEKEAVLTTIESCLDKEDKRPLSFKENLELALATINPKPTPAPAPKPGTEKGKVKN